VVGGAAQRIARAHGYEGTITLTSDLDAAVAGASAVLLQIRVGGQAARLTDETIPLRCGCIGQETTGAGGFAKALRTVPVVLGIAERVRELAADDAWIVDFTNPVGIVTRALLDHGHRAVGLCNVAIGFQRLFAEWLRVTPESVQLGHAGLNHLTWIRSVCVDGEDVLPALLRDHGDEIAAHVELPRHLIDSLGAVPSYYLRYYYQHDLVVQELLESRSRAEEVMDVERDLLTLYRDPQLHDKPDLLMQRGGAYYSEAAINLLCGLFGDGSDVQVVDVRNNGLIPELPANAVIEVPAHVSPTGTAPLPVPALPAHQAGLIAHTAAYESLAAAAAVSGDREIAFRALLTHPLIGQSALAEQLLTDLLDANRKFLPAFA
jgi:6-phospho-beta-glucosidase